MEFLLQYDAHFVYVKGELNTVADALSRPPIDSSSLKAEKHTTHPYLSLLDDKDNTLASIFNPVDTTVLCMVAALCDGQEETPSPSNFPLTMNISADKTMLQALQDSYKCYNFEQLSDSCLYLCLVLGKLSIVYSRLLGSRFHLSSPRVPLVSGIV